jgi:predicted transcriptional regulator
MEKFKTREEIAREFGISRRTLLRWLKKDGIKLSNRLISPLEQEKLYLLYGFNRNIEKNIIKRNTYS